MLLMLHHHKAATSSSSLSMYQNGEQFKFNFFIVILMIMMLMLLLATNQSASTLIVPATPWNQTDGHTMELTRMKVFYAFLQRTSSPIVQETSDNVGQQCDFYQGQLVSPNAGFVAVTICSSDYNNGWIMNSAILMETEEKIVIRPANDGGGGGSNTTTASYDTGYFDERPKMPIYKTYELESDNSIRLGQPFEDGLDKKINLDTHLLYWVPSPKTVFHLDQMENESPNHHSNQLPIRRKRQTRHETSFSNKVFNIETIIFVDRSLVQRFNGDRNQVRKLILAIMNEVQLIYNFDTLKTRIRIMIQKIVYLDDRMDGPDTANGNIDQYLDNFCSWQKRLWRQTSHDSRWDHALMLTGLDLYKQIGTEKNRKVLGLAWVNGMCRPSYSCTLNEGKNFESAFVIAHELAHSLGMLHDGHDNNCEPDKYIMSERTGPGKIHWSPCSNLYLENFLRKTNLKCLERTSAESFILYTSPLDGHHLDNRLPGQQYSLNQQCQLALGNEYRAYVNSRSPFNDICKELWCFHGNWASPAHPALEGSKCGPGKTCSQGSCASGPPDSESDSYRNKHHGPPAAAPPHQNGSGTSTTKSSASSSSSGTFMRKIQRFLRSTVRSIVRMFL